jgi:hypothetical protein
MATFTERLTQPATTQTTLISGSALNGLTNNSMVTGSAFNNLSGQMLDGAPSGWLVLAYKFQSSPSAGSSISVWMLGAKDHGSNANYEDGANATYTPDRPPDAIFPVATDANAHQVEVPVFLKVGWQMPLLKNQAGQALTANNTDNFLYLCTEERQAS